VADAQVTGADDLERLARRLRAAAAGELRKDLLRGIRTAAKPMVANVRDSAGRLPHRGGLAARIAAEKYAVRTRLTGENAGVRISSNGRRGLREINKGLVRHPVHGNRHAWVTQRVEPGFFTDPLEHDVGTVRIALHRVMTDVAQRIERGF
jgi:hypothetical protein